MSVDLLLKDVVTGALASLQAEPGIVDLIFHRNAQEQREEIKAYFGSTLIDVRLGWTQHATALPCIAITEPAEEESMQFVGSQASGVYVNESGDEVATDYEEAGRLYEVMVSHFAGACDCAVYADNAYATSWISQAIKWMLLRYREQLEGAGLDEQRITRTDFMPSEDYPQPDEVYTRVVKLNYTTIETYTAPPIEVLPVRTVHVEEPAFEPE